MLQVLRTHGTYHAFVSLISIHTTNLKRDFIYSIIVEKIFIKVTCRENLNLQFSYNILIYTPLYPMRISSLFFSFFKKEERHKIYITLYIRNLFLSFRRSNARLRLHFVQAGGKIVEWCEVVRGDRKDRRDGRGR